MGICALNEYIFSPPKHYIFAITAADNIPSLKNIARAGFVPHEADNPFLKAIGREEGFPRDKRLFRFELIKAREIRDILLTLASSQEIRRGEAKVVLKLDHPLFRPDVLNLLKQI